MSVADRAVAPPTRVPGAALSPISTETGSGTGGRLGGLLATGYSRAVAAITVLALLLRVAWLDHQPLWRDEAFTMVLARRSWSGMFDALSRDSGTPLSYVLDHLTVAVSSSSTALRLPAALLGTAAVPLCAALGRRLDGNRAGLAAAAVAAVAPTLLLSSRDARMYAMAGTLVLGMTLTAWRAVERPDRGRLLVHAAVVAAALMTHWLAAIAVLMTVGAAVVALRADRRTALRLTAASALGTLPLLLLWVPFATAQFHHASEGFWVPPLNWETLLGVLTQYLAGPAVDADLPQRALIIDLQGGALLAASIAGALVLFLLPWDTSQRRRGIAYIALVGLGGIGVLILVTLRHPLLDARYASIVWAPLFALLGVGLGRLRWAAIVPLAAMAAASFALCWYPTRADVTTLVHQQLDGRVGGDDLVVVSPDAYLQVLVDADPATAARTHVDAGDLPWYWGVAAFPPGAFLGSIPAGAGTVYVITQANDSRPQPPADHVDLGSRCAVRVCVEVYAPR